MRPWTFAVSHVSSPYSKVAGYSAAAIVLRHVRKSYMGVSLGLKVKRQVQSGACLELTQVIETSTNLVVGDPDDFDLATGVIKRQQHTAVEVVRQIMVEPKFFIEFKVSWESPMKGTGQDERPSPENSWRVPIPVQTQEPPCGTSAVLTTTCATTEALA